MNFIQKYKKYKSKYLELKKLIGGEKESSAIKRIGNEVGKFNIVDVLFASFAIYPDPFVMWTNREPDPTYTGAISSINQVTIEGVVYPGFDGSFTKAKTMDIYYGKRRDGWKVWNQAWLTATLANDSYYFPENPYVMEISRAQPGSKFKLPTPNMNMNRDGE